MACVPQWKTSLTDYELLSEPEEIISNKSVFFAVFVTYLHYHKYICQKVKIICYFLTIVSLTVFMDHPV